MSVDEISYYHDVVSIMKLTVFIRLVVYLELLFDSLSLGKYPLLHCVVIIGTHRVSPRNPHHWLFFSKVLSIQKGNHKIASG